ncbi:MAG: macro domain-containing protein [Spirochaetales bacterium]|jgi:O-acetyl-ADP-ribose deacetylase (regulator of RNase III)|nr:macro domain-containing protein [Spirochaetales bacterium]
MIKYTTGNLFDSKAECIINTVNCEGFQGKGIAYQFKLKYPKNEAAYIDACKSKTLTIGKVLFFEENKKIIANFPTKNEWRKNSQYEYIQLGLIDLLSKIKERNIKSIAIPPLGCGNGGLEWYKVKEMINQYLSGISENMDIYVFEPSANYQKTHQKLPRLNVSHLLLLTLKNKLKYCNSGRLHCALFLMETFAKGKLFKFEFISNCPKSREILSIGKEIKEFETYYKLTSLEAEKQIKNNIISSYTQKTLHKYDIPILQAASLVNSVDDDSVLVTICALINLINSENNINSTDIIRRIDANDKFSSKNYIFDILQALQYSKLITLSLVGYTINEQVLKHKLIPEYKTYNKNILTRQPSLT